MGEEPRPFVAHITGTDIKIAGKLMLDGQVPLLGLGKAISIEWAVDN